MNNEDAKLAQAVKPALTTIARVVDYVADAFSKGGRLIYIGAGTSGRLGVLDASECPPTFGVPPTQVVGIIAGGEVALRNPVEGAEDSREMGRNDLVSKNLAPVDVVIGIAASGSTPYVIAGLEYAKEVGCHTASVSCNSGSAIAKAAELAIEVIPGPEVLTGSTRLKSGTAQKMVLNMISTASMVRSGKAYQNLMVDVMQSNAKLNTRAENIAMEATGASRETARAKIDEACGSVKTAIVMILMNCDKEKADSLLENAKGHVRKAIAEI
jgi:N-acetylmuramic acid 6-phosphate etherase